MSSDIRIKLSDFDAELLANIAEREGRTPEAVVLEALHELFSERLEESPSSSPRTSSRPVSPFSPSPPGRRPPQTDA